MWYFLWTLKFICFNIYLLFLFIFFYSTILFLWFTLSRRIVNSRKLQWHWVASWESQCLDLFVFVNDHLYTSMYFFFHFYFLTWAHVILVPLLLSYMYFNWLHIKYTLLDKFLWTKLLRENEFFPFNSHIRFLSQLYSREHIFSSYLKWRNYKFYYFFQLNIFN